MKDPASIGNQNQSNQKMVNLESREKNQEKEQKNKKKLS